VLHLDAKQRCLHVLHEQHPLKSLPLQGLVGQHLSFEQFLTHMLHQARAQTRLRSLQERKWRTDPFAAHSLYDVLALSRLRCGYPIHASWNSLSQRL
jgi:hypothetical protein